MSEIVYHGRREMFWLVTAMAAMVFLQAVISFVHSGFARPVGSAADILIKAGIWCAYANVVRDMRAVQGQITKKLSVGIEISAALCCLLGYILAFDAMK
jgi:hypothetical protein